jgi:hypothetical protein
LTIINEKAIVISKSGFAAFYNKTFLVYIIYENRRNSDGNGQKIDGW